MPPRVNAVVILMPAIGLLSAGTPTQGQVEQAPGTTRMVEILERIDREADPVRNPYLNDRRVAHYLDHDGKDPARRTLLGHRFFLAHELVQSGQSEAAIEELRAIERQVEEMGITLPPEFEKKFRDEMVIAHLRLGEQENCCARHSIDSCFMPIRGEGIHSIDRGSRGAIRYLLEALEADPYDYESRWLLNLAFMTLDEYPEKVPEKWLIPETAFASDCEFPRFYDVAGPLGLDRVSLAGGSIMEDFDGDGNLDIMASSWGLRDQLRYFHSNGDGTFEDRTEEAGLLGIVGGLNMNHADYDNDGRPDAFVLRGGWFNEQGLHPNSLLRNLSSPGRPFFEDVTEAAGLLSFHPTQTATWADFDNDGWLDLFIGNESTKRFDHPCELYRSNGDPDSPRFTECAEEAGVALRAYIKGVVSGDIDNDNLPDLYVSVLNGPNHLLHNDGPAPGPDGDAPAARPWRFSDMTDSAGVSEPRRSFPAWFFDYNNDGWLDLLVFGYAWTSVGDVCAGYLGLPHRGSVMRLYRNDGGSFTDVAPDVNLDRLVMAMGSNYGDLDNDGFLDFYAATGAPDYRAVIPNLMFRNDGGVTFQDVTTVGGFGNVQKGHGVAFGDIDHDGDQDLYVVMGGAFSGDVYQNLLFENPGNDNHWINLKLEGMHTNRAAIGARIRVRVATDEGERDIHVVGGTGGSFGSSSLQQEIGLGDAASIRFAEITWPATGETQRLDDLELDSFYVVREGDDPIPIVRNAFSLKK